MNMNKKVLLLVFFVLFYTASFAQSANARLRSHISAAEQAMEKSNYAEAVSHLKNAIALAPDNFVPRYILGQLYLSLNDNTRAAKHFEDAINLIDPNTISQRYNECYASSEQVSYRRVMTEIYETLAECYKNAEQTESAIRYYNLLIQLNIVSGYKVPVANALQQIFLCYAADGKWSECLRYFSEIQSFLSDEGGEWGMCEAVCHAVKGDCYANLGQKDKMISEYRLAASLGHEGAKQVLSRLQAN